jgi:YceI-like domain
MNSRRLLAGIAFLLLLLAACAPFSEKPAKPSAGVPANFPAVYYTTAAAQGKPVYRIDSKSSLVTIHVYPGGKLSHLGHEHVIASHDIQGFLLWSEDVEQRRADLFIPLETLTVDEPELRKQYGLKKQPNEMDIQGTRKNMFNKTLHVGKNRFVTVHITQSKHSPSPVSVAAILTLNKVAVYRAIDLDVESSGEELVYTGDFSVAQSEFGLQPFSVLGGLLQVKDKVDIHFRIAARTAH